MQQNFKTQKQKPIYIFKGFQYVKDKQLANPDICAWKCKSQQKKNCKSRIHIKKNGEIIKEINEHNHENDEEIIIVNYQYNKMKQEAIDTKNLPMNIISENLINLNSSQISLLPSFDSIKRNLRKIRKKNLKEPTNPKSLIEIEFNENLTNVKEGNILFYDSGKMTGNERIIIFIRPDHIDYLKNLKHAFMDGTFSFVPKFTFQLFTIHLLFKTKTLPFFYCLLPNKKQKTYENTFLAIKSKLPFFRQKV